MSVGTPSNFSNSLEQLGWELEKSKRVVETQEKLVHGFMRLFRNKPLQELKANVSKIEAVVSQYRELEKHASAFDQNTLAELTQDIEQLKKSIQTLTHRPKVVSEKARRIGSIILFSKGGRELKKLKEASEQATMSITENLHKTEQRIVEELRRVDALIESLTLSKTDQTKLRAEKAANLLTEAVAKNAPLKELLEKLSDLRKKAGWAEVAHCQILFDRFNDLSTQTKNDTESIYYFEQQFWDAAKQPEFFQFIKKATDPKILAEPFTPGKKSIWTECDELVKQLKLPGKAAGLLIPFLRFTILQSSNHTLLSESTIHELTVASEKARNGANSAQNSEEQEYFTNSAAFSESLILALEGIKGEIHQDVAKQLSLAQLCTSTATNTMDAFKKLYDAKIEVPGHIAQFSASVRKMHDDNQITPLVEQFKKMKECKDADALIQLCKGYDFKTAMIEFFRNANPSAKKDLITKEIEMESGDFITLWKLMLLKANDPDLLSQNMVDILEAVAQRTEGSRSDQEQRIGALLGPLQGTIQAINDELKPSSYQAAGENHNV